MTAGEQGRCRISGDCLDGKQLRNESSAATRDIRDGLAASDIRDDRTGALVRGTRRSRKAGRGHNEGRRRGIGRSRHQRRRKNALRDEDGRSAEPHPECSPGCPNQSVHRSPTRCKRAPCQRAPCRITGQSGGLVHSRPVTVTAAWSGTRILRVRLSTPRPPLPYASLR